jgi:hypothetical protein
VAHHIAVINVQAGAATHILDRRPDQVAPALAHIREASNSVLAEIQSVVGVLRSADEPADTEPAPGLGRLPELLAGLAAAGFTVDFRQLGVAGDLPVVADLAAYRIAQEALTNAYKHGDGTARLTVRHDPATVEIEVVNVSAAGPPEPGSGYGLLGMRERAAAAGGTLTTGLVGGDFRVHAVLPAGAPAPASGFGPRPCDRARSAGALHDIVAGHLTSVNEQAQAAMGLVTPSIAHLRETSGSVLAEIQSMGRLLRHDGEPPTGPGRLPELLTEVEAAGFPVRVEGGPRQLTAAADEAVCRIVCAAVAGARQQGVRAARLTVRHRPGAVEIDLISVTGDDFRVQAVLPVGEPAGSAASGCGAVPRGLVRPA